MELKPQSCLRRAPFASPGSKSKQSNKCICLLDFVALDLTFAAALCVGKESELGVPKESMVFNQYRALACPPKRREQQSKQKQTDQLEES